MKIILAAATALTLSGAAIAQDVHDHVTPTGPTTAYSMVTVDPTLALAPAADWPAEQRTMFDQHMASYPPHWTEGQRTAFRELMSVPPINWTSEQRSLYQEHYSALPSTWTEQQRSAYRQSMAAWEMPWMAHNMSGTASASNMTADPTVRSWAGMGGPYEEAYGDGMVSLTPRPATTNYPPCDPGPGDDNCIQLYERGVSQSLSSWSGSSGGAAGMGGPLEEVNGHADMALTSEAHTGVGGPAESRTGYPACEPGPGDDNCIQLYERGVSGAGN